MGLLDSILGGIAGNALGRATGLGRGSGRSRILMALLPIVLGMLANRGASRMGRSGVPPGGGGLGGLGGLGALAGLGGLGGLLQQFQQKGFADHVQSWIGTGENQPIEPTAVSDVFGNAQLAQIASQAGVSDDDARSGLSELLPRVVDHLTPEGKLPDLDQLSSSIDDFERELQQRNE